MKTSTAELNDELTAINEAARAARTLANISRRAETLFTEGGYRLNGENAADGAYFVHSPKGDCYLVWHSPEYLRCSCPCFAKLDTCKHLEAVDLMKQEAAMVAEYEAAEEARDFGQFDRCAY